MNVYEELSTNGKITVNRIFDLKIIMDSRKFSVMYMNSINLNVQNKNKFNMNIENVDILVLSFQYVPKVHPVLIDSKFHR